MSLKWARPIWQPFTPWHWFRGNIRVRRSIDNNSAPLKCISVQFKFSRSDIKNIKNTQCTSNSAQVRRGPRRIIMQPSSAHSASPGRRYRQPVHRLSLGEHVASVSRSGYYQLWQLRLVVRCLSDDANKTLVHAFIACRLDYCNALFFWHHEQTVLSPVVRTERCRQEVGKGR